MFSAIVTTFWLKKLNFSKSISDFEGGRPDEWALAIIWKTTLQGWKSPFTAIHFVFSLKGFSSSEIFQMVFK